MPALKQFQAAFRHAGMQSKVTHRMLRIATRRRAFLMQAIECIVVDLSTHENEGFLLYSEDRAGCKMCTAKAKDMRKIELTKGKSPERFFGFQKRQKIGYYLLGFQKSESSLYENSPES